MVFREKVRILAIKSLGISKNKEKLVDKDNKIFNDLFRSSVRDVAQIQTNTVTPYKPPTRTVVRKKNQHHLRSVTELKISNIGSSDSFFAFHISKKTQKNLKAGKLHFDATLDLHGCTTIQSEQLLLQFINDCQQQQIKISLIVHGQGHHSAQGSVLKPAVLYYLARQSAVDAFCPAQPRDGGKGASYLLIASI